MAKQNDEPKLKSMTRILVDDYHRFIENSQTMYQEIGVQSAFFNGVGAALEVVRGRLDNDFTAEEAFDELSRAVENKLSGMVDMTLTSLTESERGDDDSGTDVDPDMDDDAPEGDDDEEFESVPDEEDEFGDID